MSNSLPIIGIWIPLDDAYYKRATEFAHDKPGYQLKPDGRFIRRDNIGWCGTPPVTYGNFDGQWKSIDETTLIIHSSDWRGPYTKHLQYQFVNNDMNKVQFKWID